MCPAFSRFSTAVLTALVLLAGAFAPRPADAVIVAYLDAGTNLDGVERINFAGSSTGDVSGDGHGTTISSIIAQFVPVGQILAITVVDSNFTFTQTASEAGLAHAAGIPEIRVIDLSNRNLTSFAALQAAIAEGKLLVTNSGNRGGPRPDGIAEFAALLEGKLIIVGALDKDGTLASYSNAAGDLAAFYIVAPGFNGFTDVEGTSFAKPHVTAAAAVLFTLFPNLTAEEVAEILFTTAKDLGAAGIDATFGNGELDLEEAIKPREPTSVPTSSSGGSGGGGVVVVVVVGAALIKALTSRNRDKLKTTLVLDRYGRGFSVDLGDVARSRQYRGSLGAILKSINRLDRTYAYGSAGNSQTFIRISKQTLDTSLGYDPVSWINDQEVANLEPSFSIIHSSEDGSGYRFHINNGVASGFGALGLTFLGDDPVEFLSNNIFTTPFMGYSAVGFGSQISYPLGEELRFSMGFAAIDEKTNYGVASDASIFELSRVGKKLSGSVYFGQLAENGSLFGGSSAGPFSVDDTATYSIGFSTRYRLSHNARLIGNYVQGYSRIDDAENSLLHGFSSIKSNSWGLGLVMDNLFARNDRFGFALSQPLRVTAGSAELTVPQSIDANDNITFSAPERINLSPGGRETTLESFYRIWLGKRTQFTTFLMHQFQPEHDPEASGRTSILGILEHQF